ncbi:MAG: peptidase M23b [Candidatus Nomurabacteria bacterium]|nr:peptidase M23b [Candidatus Nomurabacteria bacterium]
MRDTKNTSKLFSALMGIFFILTPIFLSAQSAAELQSNLDSLSAKIKALDKEIESYNNQINKTQGDAKTLKVALADLELRRGLLSKEIDKTKLSISQAESAINETQGKIVVTETVLDKKKSDLALTFRNLVQEDQSAPPLVLALGKGAKFSDAIELVQRQSDLSRAINQKVEELSNTKNVLADQKKTFEDNKQALEELNSQLNDKKALVDQNAKDKSNLLVQTKSKESEYQKLLADRQKKKGELEAEMIGVESQLKTIVDATKIPKIGKGVLQYPLDKVIITQYFGNTPFASKNPQVYNGSGHNGIDLGIPVGTPVLAAASGVVVGTGNTDAACSGVSYGKWVLIKHNNGLSTLYAHLSVIQVTAGQQLTAKQKIGLSGNTGYSTGPHVHFTVYASDAVHITGPGEYKSKVCGTDLIMPIAPPAAYLNPLSFL